MIISIICSGMVDDHECVGGQGNGMVDDHVDMEGG